MPWLFLSSGLFLGWSLGANDAANVFGTAVGTRMIRFRTAALLCGVFVVIGAVFGGKGTSDTLGALGSISAIAGAFTVALAAAVTVYWMTRLKLPVSTSQAIVGAIIGWNLFAGAPTDTAVLTKITGTWVVCPILSALFAMVLYLVTRSLVHRTGVHLIRLDQLTRHGLVLVGIFGAYSLGANNIANVVGVFVPSSPFQDVTLPIIGTFTGAQQLFFLGGLAIAVGVATYSRQVMETVGAGVFRLSPVAALVVVLSESLVLFLFASRSLESWLAAHHLPTIPLVPVSSSQAVVGAVIGIGLIKGARGIRYRVLGHIAIGWVLTPVVAGILAFFSLFFMENVFRQPVRASVSNLNRSIVPAMSEWSAYDSEPVSPSDDFSASRTARANRFKSPGFWKNPAAPASVASRMVRPSLEPDRKKTGTWARSCSEWSARSNVSPSITGICMSITMASGGWANACFINSPPSETPVTSNPRLRNRRHSRFKTGGLSSPIRILVPILQL